jgi:hypothetical protein
MNKFSSDERFVLAVGKQTMAWSTATGELVLGPYYDFIAAEFREDGRSLSAALTGNRTLTLDLTPENRTIAELELEATCLRAQKLDESGGLVPLGADSLIETWDKLEAIRAKRVPADE